MIAGTMPTILIADDHPLFREALKHAVARLLPDATLHEADSAELAVPAASPPVMVPAARLTVTGV